MSPIIKVTDPNNIKAIEIPINRDPKAAGEISRGGGAEDDESGGDDRRDGPRRLGKDTGSGGVRRM